MERELAAVKDAQRRLAAGTYGRCVTCRAEISDERLAAVPSTERCHDHQAEAETLLELRYVDETASPLSAGEAATLEARRHLDLIPDDERDPLAGDLEEDLAAEEVAIHVSRP